MFREYVNLMFRLAYRKPVMIGLVTFDVLMISWVFGYYSGIEQLPVPEYPQYMAIFLITVVQPIGIFITVRQNYRSSSRLHETSEIEFGTETLRIRGKSFFLEYQWNKTFRVLELNDWILIYENTFAAIIIPKRLMNKKEIADLLAFIGTLKRVKLRVKRLTSL